MIVVVCYVGWFAGDFVSCALMRHNSSGFWVVVVVLAGLRVVGGWWCAAFCGVCLSALVFWWVAADS